MVVKRGHILQVCATSNSCNNVAPPVLLLYCDTPGVIFDEKQPYISQLPLGIINWKHINIRKIKSRHQCSKRIITRKNIVFFGSPAHSLFTFDVYWGGLGTSIFGNSSSAANNTRSRLASRLSFGFYDDRITAFPARCLKCDDHFATLYFIKLSLCF